MFIDGEHLSNGVDLETLPAKRFVHVLSNLYVEDVIAGSEDADESRKLTRARLNNLYNGRDSNYSNYGEAKDTDPYGYSNGGTLPYIPPTELTDDGYVGLDPSFE